MIIQAYLSLSWFEHHLLCLPVSVQPVSRMFFTHNSNKPLLRPTVFIAEQLIGSCWQRVLEYSLAKMYLLPVISAWFYEVWLHISWEDYLALYSWQEHFAVSFYALTVLTFVIAEFTPHILVQMCALSFFPPALNHPYISIWVMNCLSFPCKKDERVYLAALLILSCLTTLFPSSSINCRDNLHKLCLKNDVAII